MGKQIKKTGMIHLTDVMSKEQRSKNMSAIRSQSKLENAFTKYLWNKGLRFRKNVRTLYGNPDIAIKKYKIVIFIDSCFWHKCPDHFKRPQSNQEFWDKKLNKNVERDQKVTRYYLENGWNIKRIWEHEIRSNLKVTTDETLKFIDEAKVYMKSKK